MVPRLLPDEHLPGYVGRIRWLSGTRHIGLMLQSVHARQCIDTVPPSEMELVAKLNELSLFELASKHTYWPFLHAKPPYSVQEQVEDSARNKTEFCLLRNSRRGAWLCAHCVEEDLAFWHLSYWRRSHHIPGAHWCLKHQEPLLEVQRTGAFDRAPHHWLKTAIADHGRARLYQSNPIIARYIEAFDLITERSGYLDRSASCKGLRRVAGGSEAHFHRTKADMQLTSIAKLEIPDDWLRHTFVGGHDDPNGESYNMLSLSRGANGFGFRPTALVLASAMLHTSSEAAAIFLIEFLVNGPNPLPPRKGVRRRGWSQHASTRPGLV